MLKQSLTQLRMEPTSPSVAEARRIASANLRTRGMRLHLILAALLTMTFVVGTMYLTENLFAVVPWVSLHEYAYELFAVLDVAFYLMDAAVLVFLGCPLLYGCAAIFHAAADGRKLPLVTLFDAFGHARTYGRAIAVMLIIIAPRAFVFFLLHMLWSSAAVSPPGIALLLGLLSLALIAIATLLFGLDDALLSLALQHRDSRITVLYRQSLTLTRHRLTRIWLCKLTYIGWTLLSVFTLGVLFFGHTLPYYCLSHAVWTDDIYRQ